MEGLLNILLSHGDFGVLAGLIITATYIYRIRNKRVEERLEELEEKSDVCTQHEQICIDVKEIKDVLTKDGGVLTQLAVLETHLQYIRQNGTSKG